MTFVLHRVLVLAALVVVAAACGGAAVTVGVTDPETLAKLEITTPDSVDWTRTVAGVEIIGSGTQPDAGELALVEAALNDIPEAIIAASGIRTIYRVPDASGADVEERTLAFSRGPDIYLMDVTFEVSGGTTRLEMTRILSHELAHVSQFNSLTEDDLETIFSEDIADPILASSLVRDFAAAIGWSDVSATANPEWLLRSNRGTTEYGLTNPAEDMAEAVSLILSGQSLVLSQDRINWVEEWLGVNARTLIAGTPYIPGGAVEITSAQAVYDEAEVAKYATRHVEPVMYDLGATASPADVLAGDIAIQLSQRALAGQLTRVDDNRLARYSGHFLRSDGSAFWVELWDFRTAQGIINGPDGPVLVYVALW